MIFFFKKGASKLWK